MKVILFYANFIKSPRPTLPLGMAYITAALKKAGHDVRIVDLCWITQYHVAVIESVKKYKPDAVGISFRNLDNVTFLDPISYAPNLKRIVQCCNKYSDAKVIIGGTGVSVEPIELMRYVSADYGLIGEGEISMVRLLDKIADNADEFSDIPGLIYFSDDNIVVNPLEKSLCMDRNVLPDRKIYLDDYYEDITAPDTDEENLIYNPIETIQGKRGCGLHCSYCIVRKLQGNNVTTRSPKLIVEEMKRIMKDRTSINEFEFVDATFNYPYEHAVAVCEEIIRSGIKIKWRCQLSVKSATPELIQLMEQSGCSQVELGTDSLSDRGLESLYKEYDFQDVLRVDDLISKSEIKLTHCIFLGAPGEDPDQMRQALDRWKILKGEQFFGTLGIRVYKNTALYQRAIQDGIIGEDHNPLMPTFYLEPKLLKNMSIFKEIQDHVNSRKNWHLWWSLERSDLITLVNHSISAIKNIHNLF